MTVVKEKEIEKACSILFGNSFSVEKETIEYLQLSGIKRAFRSRVKECHPDLGGSTGTAENENFIKLKDAYDFLISVKSGTASRQEFQSRKPEGRKPQQRPEQKANGTSYGNPPLRIPARRLKLGEYLYYSGRISWEELIAALTWQRKNKQKGRNLLLGNYFTRFNILSSSEMGFAVFKMNVHNANYQDSRY